MFAYRPGHSTEKALFSFSNDLLTTMDTTMGQKAPLPCGHLVDRKGQSGRYRKKTRSGAQKWPDCNLAIFPATPAANLMPGVSLCFPQDNIKKDNREGYCYLGNPEFP